MSFKAILLAGVCALSPNLAAADMTLSDAYARAASAMAQSGAAFMAITNQSDTDDRVLSASSDVADRVELHTHINDDGVMRMVHVEDGFAVGAGETIMLQRGGMHVMFLGLTRSLAHGDEVDVTLTFETADPVTITIPVDLERQPGDGGMGHGTAGHGAMDMGHAN
jgi:copper(I)-binding protein